MLWNSWLQWTFKSVYPKCHFIFFLINWNTKLEIKFWFLFLYWNWDIKHKTNWFFDFQNNRTLKIKLEVHVSFFILVWQTKNQIYLNKYFMKLVTRSHYAITIKNQITLMIKHQIFVNNHFYVQTQRKVNISKRYARFAQTY